MTRLLASLLRAAIVAGAVAGVSLGGAALVQAVGAPADQSAIVHGCYATKGGLLKIVDPGVSCGQDVQLDWLRAGKDGDVGATGATGPMGATGPAGLAGHSGADGRPLVIERVSAFAAGSGRHTAEARCPADGRALSGGWSATGAGAASLVENGPTDGSRGWRVVADRAGRWTLTVTALCQPPGATPAPAAVPDGRSPRAACSIACLPATMTLADAVARGVPVVVAPRGGALTVSVALRSGTGVVARAVRRARGAGALRLAVPLTGRGARRLAARRATRLTASITIRGGGVRPAIVTRRLTVRS